MRITGIGTVVVVAMLWTLLWGSASPANVVGGIAVGLLLTITVPTTRPWRARRMELRVGPALQLVGYMLLNAVRSNVVLIREVLSPGSTIRTGVVGVRLPECSDELITLISNLLALTPGTMPIELVEAPRTLFIHVLHLRDVADARHEVQHMTALAVRAFGTERDVASIPDGWRHRR